MPAVSSAQHGLMGLVLAFKRGDMKSEEIPKGVKAQVMRMAGEMTSEQVEDFTSTKSSSLPRRSKERTAKLRRARG